MAIALTLITLAFGPVVGRNPHSLHDRARGPSIGTDGSNPALSSGESPTNRARRVPPEGRRLSDGQLTQLWERPFDRPGVGRDDPIVRRWSDAALTSRSASSCSAGGSVTATDAAISSLARAVLALQVALASNP